MEQWIEIASKNGLAVLVIFALGYFFYKKVWPLVESKLANAEAQQKENQRLWREQGEAFAEALRLEREDNARRFEDQGKIFMESLRTQNVLAAETHKESMKAQKEITQELRALNKHLRNGNGK
jgi:hypothetical protein